MPQMKPMNWILLMFYFLLNYLYINSNLYFMFINNVTNDKVMSFNKIKFNLKW